MIVLGVDYGRRKIGLALSEGDLAQPFGVMKVASHLDAIEKIRQIASKHSPERIIVGVSEGKMAEEQKKFARLISQKLGIVVETWDETLTTEDAKSLALEAGMSRAKRRKLEDAFAASLMLQSYLDYGQTKSP